MICCDRFAGFDACWSPTCFFVISFDLSRMNPDLGGCPYHRRCFLFLTMNLVKPSAHYAVGLSDFSSAVKKIINFQKSLCVLRTADGLCKPERQRLVLDSSLRFHLPVCLGQHVLGSVSRAACPRQRVPGSVSSLRGRGTSVAHARPRLSLHLLGLMASFLSSLLALVFLISVNS